MRRAPAFALAFVALLALAGPAAACHGRITEVGTDALCLDARCPYLYLVTYFADPAGTTTHVVALYQETNGILGVQRGPEALAPGGIDHCVAVGPKDLRLA